jgi:hypothetical protein
VKHYGASSPIWPTRTEKGEAHQLVWPQEVDKPNTFGSFPESNHASSALQFVNNCLSVMANDKSSQGSSFSGFGASFFPVILRLKILKSMTLLSGKRPQFVISLFTQGPDLLAEEETLPLLDHHLPCPEAKHRLPKERTQQTAVPRTCEALRGKFSDLAHKD